MILVFDFGTTTIKAALFNLDGGLESTRATPIRLLPAEEPIVHEVDPAEWLRAMKTLCAALLPRGASEVQAMVVSGNGPTIVVVDSGGRPLRPAITWLDRRGPAEAQFVRERCGVFVDPSFYLPKILWVKNNEPGNYQKAAHFLSCPEYIAYYLTGEAAMVFPGEGLENLVWTGKMIQDLELDERKFPRYVEFGHPLGTVTNVAAVALGLREGIQVFAGGPDFMMSILGTAAVKPGRACDRAGTSEGINVCSKRRIQDERLLCYRHIVPDLWNVAGIISTSGKALEWYGESLLGGAVSYEKLDAMAAQAAAGARKLIFLPYLSGERTPIWDFHARGVFLGLALHHGTADLARAVMESTGFAIRDVLSAMDENGIETEELTVAGRPAKSGVWNQIKADITGKRILVPENLESELVGDMCIAMHRLHRYSSPADAALELVKIKEVIDPTVRNEKLYAELFEVYRQAYTQLKPVFLRLASIETRRQA